MSERAKFDTTTDAFMIELREHFDADEEQWRPIRDEGRTDMRYVSGDPWEPTDRKARESAGRPCLALDELNQYYNQVINHIRANPKAVKFSPEGEEATKDTAELYSNKMREIEYRSKAQIAYITAAENAIQRSYGYCRVNTRYGDAQGSRFVQDIWLEDIPNPDMVLIDCDAKRPDSSDMTRAWLFETWTQKEFTRKFKGAKVTDFSTFLDVYPHWVKGDKLLLAEYWKIKTALRKLLLVQPPAPVAQPMMGQPPAPPPEPIEVWADEFLKGNTNGFQVLRDREAEDRSVCQYLTNGLEVLKETPWPGKYIPIVSCYGKVIYVDDGSGAKRQILSMTRLARDPYMLYCYYRTAQAEQVGMSTKFPFFAYEGQLTDTQMQNVAKSMHEPVAVLTAKATTEATGQQILPLPQRQIFEPAIQALEMGAEGARRAIQAAMATSFLPTQAQRRNEKSGKALEKMDEIAQVGSFHFNDHYDDMITHVGIIVEDLMDKIYDSKRDIGVRTAKDESEIVTINDPENPKSVSTKGHHGVTVSTGPSYNSERERASEFADTLAGISPQIFALLGPMIVKLKNLGPIGDEMAELLKVMQPPEVRAAQKKEGEPPTPEEMQAELAQAQGKMQELMQIVEQAQQALATEQAKQQAAIEKARMDNEVKLQIAQMDNETRLQIEALKVEADSGKQSRDLAFKDRNREDEQAHELALANANAQQTVEMADRQHEQALESGDQSIDGQIAVQASKPQATEATE